MLRIQVSSRGMVRIYSYYAGLSKPRLALVYQHLEPEGDEVRLH